MKYLDSIPIGGSPGMVESLVRTRFLRFSLFIKLLFITTIMSAQTVSSFPYNENFDSPVWTTPNTITPAWSTASNATGGANALWQASNFTTGWASGSGAYTPAGANGTTKSVRFHDFDCPSGGIGELYSPTMNFSSFAGEKAVSFWHINTSGTDVVRFAVSTDNGTTWGPNLLTLGVSAVWTKYTVPIGNTTSATVKIKFSASGTFGSTDIGIDEVSVFSFDPADPSYNVTATALGGLWNSTATWVGGQIPPQGAANVTIPAGSVVTIDNVNVINTISVSGILQWNATAGNSLTTIGNFTVNAGGVLNNHTSTSGSPTINCGGNFINNGYVNMAIGGSLTMNGAGTCSISGTGTFEGDGTNGIIRSLTLGGTGNYSVNTSQNIVINSNLSHLAGTLNTNGKLTIDNTRNLFGRPLNTQLASVAVTNMGSGYTSDPVVLTPTASQWTSGAAGSANSRYVNAGNVYLLTSGTTQGTTAPTHTSGAANNFLWLCSSGSLGTLYLGGQSHTAGTQYVYGDNLYLCTVTGNGLATAGPTHTSGASAVGATTFLYIGPAIKVSVNRDATTSTIRSLGIVNAGSGYAASPAITFVGGGGTGAAATAIVPQSVGGVAYAVAQKSGESIITGGLTINSDAGASVAAPSIPQASAGVGSVFCTNGGANYTIAPQIGFSPPTALNLVTNGGSGFTSAPTITVTGGTQPAGATALATGDFTITMNQGKVVSVYVNTTVTKTYITPPTLSFSGGGGTGATLAFPANCWPAATASIGANRQITSFTVTNNGYGYVVPPSVAVGNTSGTATGGTYTTAASGFTSRVAAYYLVSNFYTGATAAGTSQDDAYIPSNRKMHALWLNGNDNGMKLTNNLTLISSGTGTTVSTATAPVPLRLVASGSTTVTSGQTGNVLDLGGNNIYCSWNGFAGATSTAGTTVAYVKNGSITLTTRGGGTTGSTLNYPFLGNAATGRFQVATGTGTATITGADILTVKVTELGAPTNSGTPAGNGVAVGNRAYRVETTTIGGVAGTAGTNPQVRLNWMNTVFNGVADGLTTTQDQTFVGEASATTGPWTVRSASVGASGALVASGEVLSPTVAPGPIALASGNIYAWVTAAPTITGTDIDGTTVCANSASFVITGTNFVGVSAVAIGGTAVTAFTVVNNTTINATVGSGTTGVVSVTKSGLTVSGIATITVLPSPSAPTLTQSAFTGSFGSTQSVTASGAGGTFNWYNVATGGTAIATGDTYAVPACATGANFWVAENNGSCEGARAQVSITVSPAIAVSANPAFICENNTPVSLSTNITGGTYAWTSSRGTLTSATAENPTLNSLTYTSEVAATISKNGCTATTPQISVGVYGFPAGIVPTATPSQLCSGTPTTLATGLSAGNFSAVCATPSVGLSTPPAGVTATTLILNGVAQTLPSGVAWSGSLDDGKFGPIPMGFNFNYFGVNQTQLNIGTNGVLNFGSYASFSGSQYQFTGGFPAAANPASTVAVCARDLRFGTPAGFGSLRYWTEGVAPNRRFIVQYENVPIWTGVVTTPPISGFNTVEGVFYETLGQIDIRVFSATNGTSTTAAEISKYIGLQDATKTIGATAPNCSSPFQQNYWNGISQTITSPLTWSFIPPKSYTYNWTNQANTPLVDAGTNQLYGTGTNLASPTSVTTTSTTQTPNANITYQVYIKDPITACAQVYPVTVGVTDTPPAPTTSYGVSTPLVMCGTQVPVGGSALVTCPTCSGSASYNWYTESTGGSLFQGSISENFNSGVNPGTFTLYNAAGAVSGVTGTNQAQLLNTRCELTQGVASQYGAILLGSTGVNTNAYEIDFDLRIDQSDNSGGADGMSYSFGDNVVASQEASMNAENGTGNKLKVAFVTYSNGSSPAGIYLMYNCTTNEQTPTTAGVLAYSNDVSWKNTTSDMHFDISINASGQVTLMINGIIPTATNGTFNNAQLPAAYSAENKATWKHVFKARTGAAYSRCSVDNMIVVSQPPQNFNGIVQELSTSNTYYVQTIDGICGSATRTPVAVTVNPAPTLTINAASTTICPGVYTLLTTTYTGTVTPTYTWAPTTGGFLFVDALGATPYTGQNVNQVYVLGTTAGALPAIYCNAIDGPAGAQSTCSSQGTIALTVGTVPAAPVITASATSVCSGSTITLSAGAVVNYSTPSVSNPTFDEDLGNVTLTQGATTVLNNTSTTNTLVGTIGTATGTAGGYANYTAFGPYNLNVGTPVNFSVSSITTGTSYSNMVAIFIDYNQNGSFSDAGETVYVEPATTSGPHTATGSFTIPSSALSGLTRMRVMCHEGTITSPTQSVSYGEFEDYAINIVGGVTYTYVWTGGITANTVSVTSPAITANTSFSATMVQGGCSSASSNTINVNVAGTPTVTATVATAAGGYSTPSVGSPTFDEDVAQVRIRVDFNNDGAYNAVDGDFVLFNNTTAINSLVGSIGTATGTAGGYSNFTSFGPYTLNASYGHQLTIGSIDQGGNYSQALAAWIDYNQDGDFADAGEQIINGATQTTPHNRSTFFNIPAGAFNGVTRLRVMCNEGAITSPTQSVFYGEFEDYAVNITGATNFVPCPGATFNLAAVAANGGEPYTYAWTVTSGTATISNAAIANPTVIVTADAVLSVTVTDACGNTVSASTATADVLENPLAITPSSITVCGSPGTDFTVSGGSNYAWTAPTNGLLNTTSGATVTANTEPIASAGPMVYTVSGTFGAGCTGTASATLNYTLPPYTATVTDDLNTAAGTDNTLCGVAGTVNFTATPSVAGTYTYTWTQLNGSTLSATSGSAVTATIPTTAVAQSYVYNVSVSDGSCVATASTGVSYFSFTAFNATVNGSTTPANVCLGTDVNLDAGVSTTNFSTECIAVSPAGLSTAPLDAKTLILNGVTQTLPSGVTNPSTSLDDGFFAGIPIGFNFNFFGETASNVFIGTNGTIVVNVPGAVGSSQFNFSGGFPSTGNPASTIAVCARDLRFGTPAGQGSVRYWTEGVAPTRRFIVQYDNVPNYSGGGSQNAEAILYESTGVIDIRVISATNGTGTFSSAEKYIGLQNALRTIGATARNCSTGVANYWNGVTNEITTAQAWRFNPPVNYTFAWTATPSASTVVADATLGTTTASTLAVGTNNYSVLITNPINGCFKTDNVSVTIDPTTVAGTTTGALAEVCNGSGTTLSLAGNTGTIQWSSSANATGPFTNIASANGSSLNTGNLSSTQYYLATVTSGVCPSQGSNIVGVVVSPTTVAGTISAPTALCYDANTSAVLSGSVGSIVWQSSADDVTYTTIAGETNATLNINNLTTSTYYKAVVTSGVCPSAEATAVNIQVDPTTVAGTLSVDNANVCDGNNTYTLTLAGHVGTIMGWEYSVYNNSTGLWSNYFPLTGVSGSSNVFTNLTSTTRYRVNVKSGVCNQLTSNVVVVNVTNYPAASISVVGISCASNNATVAINVTGMGGYSGTYSGTLSDGSTFSGASSPLSATSATVGSALTIASLTADLGGCTTTTGFSGSVTLNTYYADTDGDGFGSASFGTSICSSALSGYVALSTDCDDNAAASYPNAPEICNNTIDENCDGSDEICAGDAFSGPVVATTIGQFGTGVQFNSTVNLATASGSIQSPGIGNDVWYQFTAQFNAIRIALTGSGNVADDNDLGLYNNPANPSIQLQPIVTENDVHPGDVGSLNADGGSETLLYGNLVVGQVYYICVRNNNNTPGTCSLMISYLRGSQADIGPYTGGTGVYNNTCSNFKAAFRANASGYTVKRWTSTTITGTPSWVFAIPSGTICQLGRILPANMTGTPVTHYVTVDVAYNLPDAYGTLTPITANGTVASPVGLNSEAAVTVRAADQCTAGFKSATTGSIATDRSVCGTDRYNWQFTQVFPLTGLPLSFNGGAGATRIFPLAGVTGIANGQRYNVKVRSIHVDGVSMSAFGATPACVKTIGAAGMATENTNETYAQSINGDVVTSIFPNPNNGQSVNLSVVGMEGELQVRIVDATGRMVYANRYIVEGSINTSIDFGQTLAGGVYMVEMIQNGDMQTMRMVVNR